MYAEVVDDPKVQRLPDKLFKIWVNLLCICTRNGGALPSYDDVAFKLRITEEQVRKHVETFLERMLFDDTEQGIIPHNWNERQYKSDVSSDRVKRFRERQRNVSETPTETEQSRVIAEQITPVAPKGARYTEEFLSFWQAYPHKVGKDAAWRAWAKRKDRPMLPIITAAIRSYVASKPDEREFCNPATWLNQGRWNDAPAQANGEVVTPTCPAGMDPVEWFAKIHNIKPRAAAE